jgi:hypothetical protein
MSSGTEGQKVLGDYLTRVGRVVLACTLVAAAIWPIGIQPQATQAAPVYAAQTQTLLASPTPTPPPLAGEGTATQATPPTPHTPPSPPLPSSQLPSGAEVAIEPSLCTLDLLPLKAVLLVGPIDGDYGSWTTQEKQNMGLAAAELAANGVTVYKFYTPNNDWEQIKAAAEGAHFLFYRGHGVYWSPMPHPTVGGFALKNRFVSSDDIRNDLHLAPNAIVMLYGCFTAGSSSIDDPPIDSAEAQRRVAQYSDPFFDIGAAGYYANWFGDAFRMFVRYLFQGMTQGEAYESYFDFNSATVEHHVHPDHPDKAMWLDKDSWGGQTQYNNAFVGLPDQTLEDLFQVAAMELTPPAITYLAEPSFPARTFTVRVDCTSSDTFTWTATITPTGVSWIDVQPLSGSSGQQMTVMITPTGKALGIYQANIRVVANDPEVQNGDQTIPATMHVLDRVHSIYLPAVSNRPHNYSACARRKAETQSISGQVRDFIH